MISTQQNFKILLTVLQYKQQLKEKNGSQWLMEMNTTSSELTVSVFNCELCKEYETYKKEALDLHMTMVHKYKKMGKSESKLAQKA